MKQTIESFEHMVHLFIDMPEKIDNRLDSIQNQIHSLEEQINFLVKKVAELQVRSTASHPPIAPKPSLNPPPITEVNPAEAKKEVMKELRDLLEKRKHNQGK